MGFKSTKLIVFFQLVQIYWFQASKLMGFKASKINGFQNFQIYWLFSNLAKFEDTRTLSVHINGWFEDIRGENR